jgi:hypothetical protein
MVTRAGVGRSRSRDSAVAGRGAAREAIAPLEGRRPSIVIAFATTGHDQEAVLRGIREVTGDAPQVGASGEGTITDRGSDETSHAVAVAAITSDAILFETFFVPEFVDDSRAAGRALAAQIRDRRLEGGLLILFPDGIGGNCRELIDEIVAGLDHPMPIVGGTAGDLLTFERTYQYHGDHLASGGVSALWIGGDVVADVAVTHGCDLVGSERVVTRASGGWVEEIGGQTAWSFFQSYLAGEADSLGSLHIASLLLAERIGTHDEGVDDFAIRVPVRLDQERGALFFAAGIREGTRVQPAMRNPEKLCARASDAARRIVLRHGEKRPVLVLDLECAGRGALLFGQDTTSKLIAPVQAVFGAGVPWIGLHTYGEIAPVAGKPLFHNYTAVLCAIYAGAEPLAASPAQDP